MRALVSNYTSQTGRDPKDLFEPSDGFHPSQLANALLAEQLWQHLEAHYPQALGQTNPHNAEIERLEESMYCEAPPEKHTMDKKEKLAAGMGIRVLPSIFRPFSSK